MCVHACVCVRACVLGECAGGKHRQSLQQPPGRRLHAALDAQPPALCSGAAFSLGAERAHRSTCAGGILLLTRPPPSSVQKVTCLARHPDAPLILPRPGLSIAPPPPSMPARGDLAGNAEMSASSAPSSPTPAGNVGTKHQTVAMSRSPRAFCLSQLLSMLEESHMASAAP